MIFLRWVVFFCLLSTLVFATEAQHYKPYWVTVVLNNQNQDGFYHCYLDEQAHVWMSEKELTRLGFPSLPSALEVLYQGDSLRLLTHYKEVKFSFDENKLVLSVDTPLGWADETNLVQNIWTNGRIRPEHPGFFLIMT